jgi:hypothetical protein
MAIAGQPLRDTAEAQHTADACGDSAVTTVEGIVKPGHLLKLVEMYGFH